MYLKELFITGADQMKVISKYSFFMMVVFFAACFAGCTEDRQQGETDEQMRLVANENMELKNQLAQKEKEIAVLKESEIEAQKEREIEKQKEQAIAAQKEREIEKQKEKATAAKKEKEIEKQKEKAIAAQKERELSKQKKLLADCQKMNDILKKRLNAIIQDKGAELMETLETVIKEVQKKADENKDPKERSDK